ncbi:MAG TPA: DUF1349 domain-containing protein [Rectinemataceae bacterium]|nr:DUF1349 domain-containing protein [Rectinemataceae bacterium]
MLIMNPAVTISETKDTIEIVAPAESDFFIDPDTGRAKSDAPFYYEKVAGDFIARVIVKPSFKKKYDAGGIFVYDSVSKWIKLEFEMTDLGHPSVVSVVTDASSDDANGEALDKVEAIRLQIARRGDLWALHYSLDGRKWKMVRYFRLKMKAALRVGLEAQSPVGRGCSVEFRGYTIVAGAPTDMRKGR